MKNNRKSYFIFLSHAHRLCAWFSLVLFLLLFHACTNNNDIVKDFPKKVELQERQINSIDSALNAFAVINHNGNIVFVEKKKEYHFHIYDSLFSHEYYMLRNGHGDNEWIAPMMTGQFVEIQDNNYSCVLERANSCLYAVDLNTSGSKRILLEDLNKLKLFRLRNIYQLSNGRYLGVEDSEYCDVFIYDTHKSQKSIIDLGIDKNIFSDNPQQLSQSLSTYNKKNHKLALTYYAFPLLIIIDDSGKSVMRIQIGEYFPKYNNRNYSDWHDFILDICSTDKYIYLLFNEPNNKKESNIMVFDWEGKPVAKYHTNSIIAFDVDEIHSRFITLSEDNPKGLFSIYNY